MARTTPPPWDVVFRGIAVHQHTGDDRESTIRWRGGDDPRVEVETGDRTFAFGPGHPDEVTRHIFADGPGGGTPLPPPIRDPVNFDGSARNALQDRLARRRADLLTQTPEDVRSAAKRHAHDAVLAARATRPAGVPDRDVIVPIPAWVVEDLVAD